MFSPPDLPLRRGIEGDVKHPRSTKPKTKSENTAAIIPEKHPPYPLQGGGSRQRGRIRTGRRSSGSRQAFPIPKDRIHTHRLSAGPGLRHESPQNRLTAGAYEKPHITMPSLCGPQRPQRLCVRSPQRRGTKTAEVCSDNVADAEASIAYHSWCPPILRSSRP
ncbi:MAG: hypothetical protein QG656_2016 [Candidatus Hydrogenedentes bacterium]|nr:hypothetical protein [Candidatus Hydrogenedentota bacterium]